MKPSISEFVRIIFPLDGLAAHWIGDTATSVIDGRVVDFGYIEVDMDEYQSTFIDLVKIHAPLYTLVVGRDGSVASLFFDHEFKSYESSIVGQLQQLEPEEAATLGRYFHIGSECLVVAVESEYPEAGNSNVNRTLH